jgi:hypothetical protein
MDVSLKNKKKIIISSHFDLILLFFAEKLAIYAHLFCLNAKNAAFPNDLLGFNDKKIMKAQTNFVNTQTLFKITPTLKIDLAFTYMLSTKILVQLAI